MAKFPEYNETKYRQSPAMHGELFKVSYPGYRAGDE